MRHDSVSFSRFRSLFFMLLVFVRKGGKENAEGSRDQENASSDNFISVQLVAEMIHFHPENTIGFFMKDLVIIYSWISFLLFYGLQGDTLVSPVEVISNVVKGV